MKRENITSCVAIGITVLFLAVSIIPISNGYLINDNQIIYQRSQPKTSWYIDERTVKQLNERIEKNPDAIVIMNEKQAIITRGPMNSSWPMQSHDTYHTGLSPYSTADNLGTEKWRFKSEYGPIEQSSAVVDAYGFIYFGNKGADGSLFALYSNGTKKWKHEVKPGTQIWSTPAIADDGTIYVGTWGGGYLYAINPDGTEKWAICLVPYTNVDSSVSIGSNGTIYFGCENGRVYAINPNGTEKWYYSTGGFVASCPAIGENHTIYVGSGDGYLYTLFPNGTLCWRFKTGGWIKGNPTITNDGIIYVPSFDGYLYALYLNGTMKWRASTGDTIASAGVALAKDGTIYVGTEQLRAYYPNGTLKWITNLQGDIYGTVPAVSADGTIYVSAGLSIVAVNPDGTERWRHIIADTGARSSPSIGADGTVYVGSTWGGIMPYGYLHAFGLGPLRAEAGGPYQGTALQPITLAGLAFGGIPPYQYHWDFGDGNISIEINPTHTYTIAGNYTATFTITDNEGNTSTDTTTITMEYPLPTLTITRPTNAIYLADKQLFPCSIPFILGKITIQVTIEDHYSINEVIFCIHGEEAYTDVTPPYEWTWTQRNYRIKDNIYVIAYDSKGRYAEQRLDVIKLF